MINNPNIKCLSCNAILNRSQFVGEIPDSDDSLENHICLHCGQLNVVDRDMETVRLPTNKELNEMIEFMVMQEEKAYRRKLNGR